MVGYLNYKISSVNTDINKRDQALKGRLAQLDQDLKRAEADRIERESLQSFNFRIYDAVIGSLESGNPQRQDAAKALVLVMAEEPLRTSFLRILEQGGTPTIKKEVEKILRDEEIFKVEQKAIVEEPLKKPTDFKWEDYDYDIFWCESSGKSAQRQAEMIKDELISEGAKGRIRVRLLPNSINSSSGYRVSGYEIRPNINEKDQANALKILGEKVLKDYGASFRIQISTQSTPWYVSIFICI